ncbi:sugar nucleotide-binding protein [Clostridium sp. MSJ-4]|uniref:dTDP-4-dehydrorhamnose reductase n=1 Tax=Clostridium simiarum TaxID=2841506 RepID=A0ABS6EXW9_9CLOT|nr:sugar nucleotide-binding protein [Clostridium simiarum]MBU5590243.1 sugar nucleotide-binding protein [Clostridium simiarum]
MEKLLITGANGFFASRFINYYKDKYEIIPLTSKDLNITEEKKVIETIGFYKPQYVLNTAAIAATNTCEEQPEFSRKINVDGSVNVAKACNLIGAKMIYFSSEQVYNGNIEKGPYSEEIIPLPNTNYGRQKLQGEALVKEVLEEVWILRFTWLFGFPERMGKSSSNLLSNLLKAILKGEKIRVPHNEYRGMTYIYDILDNLPKVFKSPYDTYNFGSENNLSTYDVARIMLKAMGSEKREKDILIKDEERYKDNPRDIRICNNKIRQFGIEFVDTSEAVENCIKDFSL